MIFNITKSQEGFGMAFYDWNHDGKKDMVDDFIEYQVYKDCMKPENRSSNSYGGSGDGAWIIGFIVLMIFLSMCGFK